MKKRIASVVLVSAMGVGAVSTVALTPALAATAGSATDAASSRLSDLKTALKGLVSDGTITQAQADKVASTLDAALPKGGGPGGPGGHGGPGRGLSEAATVLGMTEADLRTALGTDKSLAQVAATKGISKATLISKLVAAAKTRIAAEVKAGTLTQAEADKRTADLTARITEMVDRVGAPMGHGGPHGAPPAGATAPSTAPSAATQSSTTTT